MAEERAYPFTLVHDEGNAFAMSLGLVHTLPDDLRAAYLQFGIDLAASNSDESWTLPMPARYVIDASGMVRDASIHPDYTTRADPIETLDVIEEL